MSKDEENEDTTDKEEASDESGDSTQQPVTALDLDLEGISAMQKLAEEVVQPSGIQALIEAQETVNEAVKSSLTYDALRMQELVANAVQPQLIHDAIKMDEMVRNSVNAGLASDIARIQAAMNEAITPQASQSLIRSQRIVNQAVQASMLDSIAELQRTMDEAIIQLHSPLIEANLSAIATISHPSSPYSTPGQHDSVDYPPTDIDDIRSPEERIHDNLIWDDGEWYRQRVWEISLLIVDYIFWQAKRAGELTDASDEEIGTAFAATAFFITFTLTGNPVDSAAVGGASVAVTSQAQKAAKNRDDRRDLEGRFDDTEE